ncbi:MAG: hypothetical protein HY867_11690 [Chloroflexi bacterium]|nr:hypothetical protein [Chloroflexota bacterium]
MMAQISQQILSGQTALNVSSQTVVGEFYTLWGETFYRIENYDSMPPFFMSLVSSSDHWFFISSTGGLTAGRVNAEQALFPYYTEDKLAENNENTGSKTILLVQHGGQIWLWEPFSIRHQGLYNVRRNLYKNIPGTALVFEEINHSLGLTYRYAWRTGDRFGFIKTSCLINSDSSCNVEVLDGLQNILPANTPAHIQNSLSCLLDAYKRSELDPETGLAIYALNSTLTDLPEPSESLLATTVFQVGLDDTTYLLSSAQLDNFRSGQGIAPETEARGSRGAFFVHARLELPAGAESSWHIVADVNQDSASAVKTINSLRSNRDSLSRDIEADLALNTVRLQNIVASADGLQISADPLCTAHHFANVMFNVMRGGIFSDGYWVEKTDFTDFISTHNRELVQSHADFFSALPPKIHVSELHARANATTSADLIRLSYTYLPLTFSRRHGDPSRPWNRFAINIKKPDGSQRLDYEGNWRDIFQNWEALAYSYPEYIEGMIFTFLSATTADGYNPYRISRAGIDWEIPEPGNPWANIGYWSDHQIIYLQKLLELSARFHPGVLSASLDRPMLSHANAPYRIKPYNDLLQDPYNTIQFDRELESEIERRVKVRGTDGKQVYGHDGQILHRSLTEKLLTLLLAKLVNFVPEGGIWMNTQRPEWNDANNALVGKGLSVVTLGYLRRYVVFCQQLFNQSDGPASFLVSTEVTQLFEKIAAVLREFQPRLSASFDELQRRAIMDALGQAGSIYRENLYHLGLSAEMRPLQRSELLAFFDLAQRYIEHSLRANRRDDNLYHAYNILHLRENRATISRLYEMLEGQVSILSSGLLSGDESLALLESLHHSRLYRADQNTYILYPDKTLPGFLHKNSLDNEQVGNLKLPALLAGKDDTSLLVRDIEGGYHFSGHLRNAKDVRRMLKALGNQPEYAELIIAEGEQIVALFESVFRHDEFTGRSGTFFAYEGLGSVYWHMVSKLLLAVQETILRCQDKRVIEKYRDIRSGLGFNKTPQAYGAFPTDPYSHTPKGQGARQPGMTGVVKEEILARQTEVGFGIYDGCISFNTQLLDRKELLPHPVEFSYYDVTGGQRQIQLPAGSLAFTLCQIPVILNASGRNEIIVQFTNGSVQTFQNHTLDQTSSRHIFQRDGEIQSLQVTFQ